MSDHDVDAVIRRPAGGLTGYRDAVALALEHFAADSPSQLSPSDPAWAGEVAYTMNRSAWTLATPEELWKAVDTSPVQQSWRVETRDPPRLLRLDTHGRVPGDAWLEMRVNPASGRGSRYDQRVVFYPRGLAGRVYWYGGLLMHRKSFHETFGDVLARSTGSGALTT